MTEASARDGSPGRDPSGDGAPPPPHAAPSRARAWLELVRIANLPTVVSTAVAGAVIGTAVATDCATGACWAQSPRAAWWSLLAPPLAYLAGMALNDAFDASIDARERPSRPIPSGRIARGTAFAAGAALLAGALVAAALAQSALALAATVLLVATVVLYDAVHARTAASVVLLALARALAAFVPIAAFAATDDADFALGERMLAGATRASRLLGDPRVLVLPLATAAWTLVLSTVARGEVARMRRMPDRGRASTRERVVRLASFVPPAAVLVAATIAFHGGASASGANAVLLAGGLTFACGFYAQTGWADLRRDPASTPRVIGLWIACLPLLDAIVVASAGAWNWAVPCAAMAILARDLQRQTAAS